MFGIPMDRHDWIVWWDCEQRSIEIEVHVPDSNMDVVDVMASKKGQISILGSRVHVKPVHYPVGSHIAYSEVA